LQNIEHSFGLYLPALTGGMPALVTLRISLFLWLGQDSPGTKGKFAG
jgi:hypothetical protein